MTEPCLDDVCLTCSDRAEPAVVVRLMPGELAAVRPCAAVVEDSHDVEVISVALVDVVIGDTVLVHAGEAIAVLRPAGTGASRD